jgi:hypothetical protein
MLWKSLPEQRKRLEVIDLSGLVENSYIATDVPARQTFARSGLQVGE